VTKTSAFKTIKLKFNQPAEDTEPSMQVQSKLVYYKSIDVDPDTSPLEFWKLQASNLKCISPLALRYLVMQPTSTASERTFSLAGNIFNDQRARLNTITLHRLLLYKMNDKTLTGYRMKQEVDPNNESRGTKSKFVICRRIVCDRNYCADDDPQQSTSQTEVLIVDDMD
jgi:hypothetical protein